MPESTTSRWRIVPLLMACTIAVNSAALLAEGKIGVVAVGGIPLLGAGWAYLQIKRTEEMTHAV